MSAFGGETKIVTCVLTGGNTTPIFIDKSLFPYFKLLRPMRRKELSGSAIAE